MAARSIERLPLIVIVGPTASGKTNLAIELAKQFQGEIICADSRTIYKGMDIGTAKPSKIEQAQVPHWGLDLIEPGERFTVVDFKKYTTQKIDEIRARGHVPFLVGGTGLYVDSVLFNYSFGSDANQELRDYLGSLSLEQLHKYCENNNILLPENKLNKRYVIHAIEQSGNANSSQRSLINNCIVAGITTEKEILKERITIRTEQLFENGVVGEATLLGKKYGWENESMTGNIYRIIHAYLKNDITIKEAKEKNTTIDWRLAKRQMTWLRRNKYIHWHTLDGARIFISDALAINQKS